MKKIFTKVHLWLAVPFGIVISLMCISGAILVFESELQEITNPGLYYAKEVTGNPIPLEELVPAVQNQLPENTNITSVSIPSDPKRNYRFAVSGQGRTSYLVDPYNGQVQGKVNPYEKGTFFSFMRRLHRWFMFPYSRGEFSWGKTITGYSTLVMVVILLTGIFIWIPRSRKMLKRRLDVKFKKGWFRFFYDLHLAGGFYTCLLLLVLCLTGLTFSFNWYRNGFYKLFGVEMTQQAGGGHGQSPAAAAPASEGSSARQGGRPGSDGERSGGGRPEGRDSEGSVRPGQRPAGAEGGQRGGGRPGSGGENTVNYAVWDNVVAQLKEANPVYRTITVQAGSATVATNQYGNMRASDKYNFHPYRGMITGSELYADASRATKLRGWIYSVHVGNFGGMTTKIISFIVCLIGAFLPLTGYYIFYKKRIRKRGVRI